jgi:hypothetical protein
MYSMNRLLLSGAIAAMLVGSSHADVVFHDGFEGPWVVPEAVMELDFWGEGFQEEWFVDHVEWVGPNQFWFYAEPVFKTEGDHSQAANAYVADGNPRDLYLARLVEGLEPNTTYLVTIDYRFDEGIPGDISAQRIYSDVRDGDQRSREQVEDLDIYGDRVRPNTRIADSDTFGTGEFHTWELTHTTGEDADSFTFLMNVRFVNTVSVETDNWLYLDNFTVSLAETPVSDWALY